MFKHKIITLGERNYEVEHVGLDFDRAAIKPSGKRIETVKRELDLRMDRLEEKIDRLISNLKTKV
jgi:hypothetical protein